MEEELTKVDRLVSIDVAAKFEALQDEVNLLKNEVKQTLVDLREFLMKDRTIFPQLPLRNGTSTVALRQINSGVPAPASVAPRDIPIASALTENHLDRRSLEGLDTEMLSNFIAWLGSVKKMGLSLQQITPYLEAYEASGYLQPVLLKVILRSMADLDQLSDNDPDRIFSPEEYATCIGQLHRIICEPNLLKGECMASPDARLADPEVGEPAQPGFDFPSEGDIYSPSGSHESSGINESTGNEAGSGIEENNG